MREEEKRVYNNMRIEGKGGGGGLVEKRVVVPNQLRILMFMVN